MFGRSLASLVTIGLVLAIAGPASAAIALVTVTKASQKDCKLSFTVDIQPAPSGSGAKQLSLVIPAKQVEALHATSGTTYTFQIRDGRDLPLNVPLAFTKQRDGSLQAQLTLSEDTAKKAWVVLHVWLHPDGSGTAFSIDLGSYLSAKTPGE